LVGLDKKVQPAHTALLVIDMQNDFIASVGLVGRSGRDVSAAQKLAERLPDFIAAARRAAGCVRTQRLFDRPQFLSIGFLARTGGAQAIRRLHAVSGLCRGRSAQNLVDEVAGAPVEAREVRSIGHETSRKVDMVFGKDHAPTTG
jgi:nicotinamidase-related amidase